MDMFAKQYEFFSMMGFDGTQRDPETIRHRWGGVVQKKISAGNEGDTTIITGDDNAVFGGTRRCLCGRCERCFRQVQ